MFALSLRYLDLLRVLYVMTLSAVWGLLRADVNNSQAERVLGFILVGPLTLFAPIGLLFALRRFENDSVVANTTPEERTDPAAFRGWLERFATREVDAGMLDCVLAQLVLPFRVDMWGFAVHQLVDRGLMTIFATILLGWTRTQLVLAMCLEASALVLEAIYHPFTDEAENKYFFVWRGISFAIIVTMWLDYDELIPTAAADIVVCSFTLIAGLAFLKALDVPRLRASFKQYLATSKFRGWALTEMPFGRGKKIKIGKTELKVGNLSKPDEFAMLRAHHLEGALRGCPSPQLTVRDGWAFSQMWHFLCKCDADRELHDALLRLGPLLRVEPLYSLDGLHIGGEIPRCFGALAHVNRLVLSEMSLRGSVRPLAALAHLQVLNLDRNNFDGTPVGLEALRNLTKLSMRGLSRWGDAPLEPLARSLAPLKKLRVLLLGETEFADIPASLVDVLYPLATHEIDGTEKNRKTLSGYIATSFNSLSLEALNVRNKRLTGELPVALLQLMASGAKVDLRGNEGFTLPKHISKGAIGNFVKALKLDNCSLKGGVIPSEILRLKCIEKRDIRISSSEGCFSLPADLSWLSASESIDLSNLGLGGVLPLALVRMRMRGKEVCSWEMCRVMYAHFYIYTPSIPPGR